jgi:hypothetical protein
MKNKDIYSLRNGDKVSHKHYGVCVVDHVIEDFGPVLIPESREGQALLSYQTGMPVGTPLLETSFRLIIGKLNQ